jgi:imidazole glycerol phosphate synthase subunit HisF
LVEGVQQANVDAVAAANVFHYVDNSARKAKIFMQENNIPVR